MALTAQTLSVAPDGTHLRGADGAPFFYLGDTAWEMLHRLDREETRAYLSLRAAQGFNVIQTVVLAELDGLRVPNAYGEVPLVDLDPAQPNPAYFRHVDFAVRLADSLGIYLGLLPTWGDKFNLEWGVGPEVFTPANARAFGAYLGERYGERNVIWILGGDRNVRDDEDRDIVNAMAEGLREAVGTRQLLSYHPQGGNKSTDFFPDAKWIDFHMFQTGHGRYDDPANRDFVRETRAADPTRPVINGEPAYEDHPVNWRPVNGWFDDFDARQAAYWSTLSGAAGHTFGNHNLWQMWSPEHEPVSVARTPWREALRYPGAYQIGHLGQLMTDAGFAGLTPALEFLVAPPNSGGRVATAARTPHAPRGVHAVRRRARGAGRPRPRGRLLVVVRPPLRSRASVLARTHGRGLGRRPAR